jgi:hypothetical protein
LINGLVAVSTFILTWLSAKFAEKRKTRLSVAEFNDETARVVPSDRISSVHYRNVDKPLQSYKVRKFDQVYSPIAGVVTSIKSDELVVNGKDKIFSVYGVYPSVSLNTVIRCGDCIGRSIHQDNDSIVSFSLEQGEKE